MCYVNKGRTHADVNLNPHNECKKKKIKKNTTGEVRNELVFVIWALIVFAKIYSCIIYVIISFNIIAAEA